MGFSNHRLDLFRTVRDALGIAIRLLSEDDVGTGLAKNSKKGILRTLKKRAVFTDRDGTINRDVHYLSNLKDLEVYSTVAEGIRLLNEAGFLVVIITNQSALARGFLTERTLASIHSRLLSILSEGGAKVDGVYYCPHHPDDGCGCRKPQLGLLTEAAKDHHIDPDESFFIGDHMTDVEAGQSFGCKTVLIPENAQEAEREKAQSWARPDFECRSFIQGVRWILRQDEQGQR